ncbi:MAG: hypothetical protein COT09_05605, partial [Candidatus Hydromicrobium americanum]
ALLILMDQKIIANRGKSICKEKNGLVSLSDRITKGIVEFFGSVIFELDAVSIYRKNRLIAPRNYGSSSDIRKYDEVPLFENEWVASKELKFDLADINKVLFITSRCYREPAFKDVVKVLKTKGIEYVFLSERWLADNIVTDMASYLSRIRGWIKFNKVAKDV